MNSKKQERKVVTSLIKKRILALAMAFILFFGIIIVLYTIQPPLITADSMNPAKNAYPPAA